MGRIWPASKGLLLSLLLIRPFASAAIWRELRVAPSFASLNMCKDYRFFKHVVYAATRLCLSKMKKRVSQEINFMFSSRLKHDETRMRWAGIAQKVRRSLETEAKPGLFSMTCLRTLISSTAMSECVYIYIRTDASSKDRILGSLILSLSSLQLRLKLPKVAVII